MPTAWNRQLLVFLHGTRPLGAPLVAELNVHDAEFGHLLNEGWMLAATSYRCHGLALTDALADAMALRQHIAMLFGELAMVVLEGRSMGGTAALLLVERRPDLFNAAVTVGAALLNARLALPQVGSSAVVYGNEAAEASSEKETLSNRPLAPLLLVVNESELGPARAYSRRAWDLHSAGDEDIVVPALWEIKRPGHNWVSPSERLNAVLHAASWVTDGTFITRRGTPWQAPPDFEPTHCPSPPPAGLCSVEGGRRALGEVMAVAPTGSFVVSIPRDALAAIGVRMKGHFHLMAGEGPNAPLPVRMHLNEYPFIGTQDYEWCATLEPEHEWLDVFVFTYEYCNAAKLLRVAVGTRVAVEAERPLVKRSYVAAMRSKLEGRG